MTFRAILLFLALMCGAARADTERTAAVGQWADVATTAVGLSVSGVSEANPLGIAALGVKLYMYKSINALPEAEQGPKWDIYGAFGWGAAANNLCVIATVLSGGAFSPSCLVIGGGVGVAAWAGSRYARTCHGDEQPEGCPRRRLRK